MIKNTRKKWPKKLPEFTPEQKRIRNEFMECWHEVLPAKYGIVEKFNHGFPVQERNNTTKIRTLEIGSGLGEHINYENLSTQEYFGVELRGNMAKKILIKYPDVNVIIGDAQNLPFKSDYFDRVLAIHVLEHLPDLPSAIQEVNRVMKKNGNAQFCALIPVEGGFLYSFARNISARRIFEKHFKQSYDWVIKSEHINLPDEIFIELKKFFYFKKIKYFPFNVPLKTINLCIGLIMLPK
ncbi:MAG: class I SAM-dependent methyltransferase [Candidatus Methanoperedens sp.]|nr:class I SAM-dependent methyltransferase [Candidatus Methanoperedens sp.]MCZ7394897.1 class I SAM-dependent methyltransferase [Candidatus Methanoperedens sp.]